MSIRDIFCKNTMSAILLRGIIALFVGLIFAAIVTITTGMNALDRFAFPIFIVPLLLVFFGLLTRGR